MGTSKSGRYLNTDGSRFKVSDFAAVHSNEGTFKYTLVHENGKFVRKLVLKGGGHGQDGMDLLDKYHIEYNVTKTYSNGVRLGNVFGKKTKSRDKRIKKQAWFPKSWTEKDIRNAGEYVAKLKHNRDSPETILFGTWRGVRIGIILTKGKIGTVYPTYDQEEKNGGDE